MNYKEASTDSTDFSLSELKTKVDEEDIIVNPEYQREFIYDDFKASKLIESFLMGIPVPAIYLSQEDNETLEVIDGQQRITTVINFFNNKFSLKKLEEIPEINGKFYKDLDLIIQRKLRNAKLRAITIKKESNDLKFEIFARLNQGSVSLNEQELRNCLYRGSFNQMLNDLAKLPFLPEIFLAENKRKKYQELILRFFALQNFETYKKSMKKSMNDYMGLHRHDNETELLEHEILFEETLKNIKEILGNKSFCAINREEKRITTSFSPTLYDSISIAFSQFQKDDLINNTDEIRKAIKNLKFKDEKYQMYTYVSTGSVKSVQGRISAVINILKNITGKEPQKFLISKE